MGIIPFHGFGQSSAVYVGFAGCFRQNTRQGGFGADDLLQPLDNPFGRLVGDLAQVVADERHRLGVEIFLENFRLTLDASREFAPAVDMDAEQTFLLVLFGNRVDVVLNGHVVPGDGREYKCRELRSELLRLPDFLVDFRGRQFGRRPDPLALALNAGVFSVLLAVNVDALLPLSLAAVPHDLWIFPFEREEVSANVLKFIPAARGVELGGAGGRH